MKIAIFSTSFRVIYILEIVRNALFRVLMLYNSINAKVNNYYIKAITKNIPKNFERELILLLRK